LALAGVLTLVLAACAEGNGSTSLEKGAVNDSGGGKPLTVAEVPSLDNAPFEYAQKHGYYKHAGLNVTFSTVDAGPSLITGVITRTYDIGTSAAFPLFIAASKGAPVELVTSVDSIGPGYGNSALVVKKGSAIHGYQDLQGKTVATNALTSLTTLATKVGVDRAGGNPKAVKFISLPFKSTIQAVARGKADAAVVINPFGTQAVINGLQKISDPIGTQMPKGASYGLVFTSKKTASTKASELAAFRKATARAMRKLASDRPLQRKLAHTQVGLSHEVAKKIELPHYSTHIDTSAMRKYAELVAKYGYTSKPVKLEEVSR
jgi:NitT/TauT family transport system substrate-binding protein